MTVPRHMRIAAQQCLFHSYDEMINLTDRWRDFGFNFEQLFHTHSTLYTAIFDKKKHGEMMYKYLENSRKNGISTIMYMNVHILTPEQEAEHPEWHIRDKEGNTVRLYETYASCCMNSSWIEYFLGALDSLRDYELAGVFFDGPIYLKCYCPTCQAKFREATGKDLLTASEKDVKDYFFNLILTRKEQFYTKVKEVNPEWSCYYNEGLLYGLADADEFRRIYKHNDIIGTEGGFFFYDEPKKSPYFRCAINAKMTESFSNGEKPTVIFMAGDHKPWGWTLHTPAETQLCYASALANGSSVWYGIHCPPSNLDSVSGEAAKEIIHFDRDHDAVFQGTKSLAEVAIFYSFDTAKHYKSSQDATDFYSTGSAAGDDTPFVGNYSESFMGAVDLVSQLHIPFDVVTELDAQNLQKYKVCILPNAAFLDDASCAAVRSFVAAGGLLIADSECACYNKQRPLERSTCALAELFGVKFSGTTRQYGNYNYFYLDGDFAFTTENIPRIPMVQTQICFDPAGCTVLAKSNEPLAGCYAAKPGDGIHPFLARNVFGMGTCYYFGGNFFENYNGFSNVLHRQLIARILAKHLDLDYCLSGDTGTRLLYSVRSAGGAGNEKKVLFSLINYTSGSRPIDEVVPLRNLEIHPKRKFSKVVSLVNGEPLTVRDDGTIEVPEIGRFDFILAE